MIALAVRFLLGFVAASIILDSFGISVLSVIGALVACVAVNLAAIAVERALD